MDLILTFKLYFAIVRIMSTRSKIVKAGGAEPNEFEASVAQEFANLEVLLARRK